MSAEKYESKGNNKSKPKGNKKKPKGSKKK